MKFQNAATMAAVIALAQAAAVCTPKKGNLEYIVQMEPFAIPDNHESWVTFRSDVFAKIPANPDSATPGVTCKAGVSGVDNDHGVVIYGNGKAVPGEYLTVQHRGYIMSPKDGEFTVTMPDGVDNALLFWQGEAAVRGYSNANAQFNSLLQKPGAGTFKIPVKANVAVPIRFMFANAWGPGAFTIDIKDPSGKSCFCNNGAAADCFYTEVCGACPFKFDGATF